MANTGNIQFKGTFDYSEIIKGLTEIRKQMSTLGASNSLFTEWDKQAESLDQKIKELDTQQQTGFKDTKSLSKWKSEVDKVETSCDNLRTQLRNIAQETDLSDSAGEVAELKKQLEAVDKIRSKTRNNFNQKVSTSLDEAGFTTAEIKSIQDAIDKEKDLEEAIRNVIKARQQEAATSGKTIISSQSTKDYLKNSGMGSLDRDNFKQIAADGSEIDLSEGTYKKIVAAFKNDLSSVFKDGTLPEEGANLFRKYLEEVGVEYKGAMEDIDKAFEEEQNNILERVGTSTNEKLQSAANNFKINQSGAQVDVEKIGGRVDQAGLDSGYYKAIESEQELREQIETTTASAENRNDAIQESLNANEDDQEAVSDATEKGAEDTEAEIEQFENLNDVMDRIGESAKNFLSIGSAASELRQIISETFQDVQNLDKSFASIAMVTDKTVGEMWDSYSQYADMAAELGQSTESVISASALFYQQGLDTADSLSLTTDSMKLATLSGTDFSTATSEMTAALRAFHMEMDEGSTITDVYSELAANAAASVSDIAYAMSKTASIANSAGMDFQTTSAFLTQMIETTQEAPENIGTAMKTIIARFTELKENVSDSESEFDDLDYNKVDTALKTVGVNLKDATGQFRDLDDVFLELSKKWNTLDRNQQRYIATQAAGSRQQSRFIAMMEDYDRTVELINTADNSEGQSDEQFSKYADTLEYKLNQLKTSWEEFRVTFTDSDMFKGIIDKVKEFMDVITGMDPKKLVLSFVAVMPLIKRSITGVVDSFKANSKKIQQTTNSTVKKIKKQLSNKIQAKIDVQVAKSSELKPKIEALKNQIQQQMNQRPIIIENISASQSLYNEAIANPAYISSIQKMQQGVTEFTDAEIKAQSEVRIAKELLKEEQVAFQQNSQATAQNVAEKEKLVKEDNEAAASAEKLKQAQAGTSGTVNVLKQGITGLASSVGMLAAMMISGSSFTEAFDTSLQMMAFTTIPKLIQALVSAASTAMTTSTTFGAAFAAAGGPVTLILTAILAVGLAISAIVKKVSKLKQISTVTYQLEAATNRLEVATEKYKETKESLSDTQSEYKDIQETVDEYEKLNKKLNRTEEEEEQLKEDQETIQENYSSIISYVDTETGKIEINNDLYQDQLETLQKKTEELEKQAELEGTATIQAQQDVDQITYNKNAKSLFGNGSYITAETDLSAEGEDLLGTSFQNVINNIIKKEGAEEIKSITIDDLDNGAVDITTLSEMAEKFGITQTDSDGQSLMNTSEGEQVLVDFWNYFVAGADDALEPLQEDVESLGLEFDDVESKIADYAETMLDLSDATDNYDEYYEMYSTQFKNSGKYADEYQADIAAAIASSSANEIEDKADLVTTGQDAEEFIKQFEDSDMFNWSSAENVNGYTLDEWQTIIGDVSGAKGEWDSLDTESQAALKTLGYDSSNLSELGTETTDILKQIEEQLKNTFTAQYVEENNDTIEYYETNEGQAALQQYEDTYTNQFGKMSAEQAASTMKETLDALDLEGGDRDRVCRLIFGGYTEQEVQDIIKEAVDISGDQDIGVDMSKAILNARDNLDTVYNEGTTYDFFDEYYDGLDKLNLDTEAQLQLLQQTFEDYDPTSGISLDDYLDSITKSLVDSGKMEKADAEAYKEMVENCSHLPDVLDQTIDSLDQMQTLMDNITTSMSDLRSDASDYVNVITDQMNDGYVSFDNYLAMVEQLTELGEDPTEYFDIDSTGKITTNQEKIKDLYEAQLEAKKQTIQQEINQTKIDIAQKNAQADVLELEAEQLQDGDSLNTVICDMVDNTNTLGGQWATVAYNIKAALAAAGQTVDISVIEPDNEVAKSTTISNATKMAESFKEQAKAYRDSAAEEQKVVDSSQKFLDNYDDVARAASSAFNTDIVDGLDDASSSASDAADSANDLADKLDAINDALKELEETWYGTDTWNTDGMTNYTAVLSTLTDELSRYKEALDNLSDAEDPASALSDWASAAKDLNTVYQAQNNVYQEQIDAAKEQLDTKMQAELDKINQEYASQGYQMDTDIADFYYQDSQTGKYLLDYTKLYGSQLNDEIKNEIVELVGTMNDAEDSIQDNLDSIQDLYDEAKEKQEDALDDIVSLEDTVADILKEKYQDEIDDLQDKYDAMEEANDDYYDALKEAIEKQRDLRDTEDKWEDLATKEKKYSLLSRDTSNANASELESLNDEIESDRQSLLDDTVDSMLETLKEIYDDQSEAHDQEIEYYNTLVEDANVTKEAVNIIAGWTSADDCVDWLIQNDSDFNDLSIAAQEQQMNEWKDTYNAYTAAQTLRETDLVSLIQTTPEEIAQRQAEIQEGVVDEINTNVSAEMQTLRETIEEKFDAYQDALEAYQDALNDSSSGSSSSSNRQSSTYDGSSGDDDTGDGYTESSIGKTTLDKLKSLFGTTGNATATEEMIKGVKKNAKNYAQKTSSGNSTAYTHAYEGYISTLASKANTSSTFSSTSSTSAISNGSSTTSAISNGSSTTSAISNGSSTTSSNKKGSESYATTGQNDYASISSASKKLLKHTTFYASTQAKSNAPDSLGYTLDPNTYGYCAYVLTLKTAPTTEDYIKGLSKSITKGTRFYFNTEDEMIEAEELLKNINKNYKTKTDFVSGINTVEAMNKYASGGLVDYTGPAWVDGTKSQPEAFLSADDTKRIGEAAKLLSDLPILNNQSYLDSSVSQKVGDTSFEININVDNISDDYDVEDMVTKLKSEIVNASKEIGNNVILKK